MKSASTHTGQAPVLFFFCNPLPTAAFCAISHTIPEDPPTFKTVFHGWIEGLQWDVEISKKNEYLVFPQMKCFLPLWEATHTHQESQIACASFEWTVLFSNPSFISVRCEKALYVTCYHVLLGELGPANLWAHLQTWESTQHCLSLRVIINIHLIHSFEENWQDLFSFFHFQVSDWSILQRQPLQK